MWFSRYSLKVERNLKVYLRRFGNISEARHLVAGSQASNLDILRDAPWLDEDGLSHREPDFERIHTVQDDYGVNSGPHYPSQNELMKGSPTLDRLDRYNIYNCHLNKDALVKFLSSIPLNRGISENGLKRYFGNWTAWHTRVVINELSQVIKVTYDGRGRTRSYQLRRPLSAISLPWPRERITKSLLTAVSDLFFDAKGLRVSQVQNFFEMKYGRPIPTLDVQNTLQALGFKLKHFQDHDADPYITPIAHLTTHRKPFWDQRLLELLEKSPNRVISEDTLRTDDSVAQLSDERWDEVISYFLEYRSEEIDVFHLEQGGAWFFRFQKLPGSALPLIKGNPIKFAERYPWVEGDPGEITRGDFALRLLEIEGGTIRMSDFQRRFTEEFDLRFHCRGKSLSEALNYHGIPSTSVPHLRGEKLIVAPYRKTWRRIAWPVMIEGVLRDVNERGVDHAQFEKLWKETYGMESGIGEWALLNHCSQTVRSIFENPKATVGQHGKQIHWRFTSRLKYPSFAERVYQILNTISTSEKELQIEEKAISWTDFIKAWNEQYGKTEQVLPARVAKLTFINWHTKLHDSKQEHSLQLYPWAHSIGSIKGELLENVLVTLARRHKEFYLNQVQDLVSEICGQTIPSANLIDTLRDFGLFEIVSDPRYARKNSAQKQEDIDTGSQPWQSLWRLRSPWLPVAERDNITNALTWSADQLESWLRRGATKQAKKLRALDITGEIFLLDLTEEKLKADLDLGDYEIKRLMIMRKFLKGDSLFD